MAISTKTTYSVPLYNSADSFFKLVTRKFSSNQIIMLMMIGSVGAVTHRFWRFDPNSYFLSSYFGSALLSMLTGWIGILVIAYFCHYIALFLGGHGKVNNSINAITWSLIPGVVSLVFFIALYFVFGDQFFQNQVNIPSVELVKSIFSGLRMALAVLATLILVSGMKAGYQLNIYKSILVVAAPLIISLSLGLGLIMLA